MKILASVLAASSVYGHDGDIMDGDILLTKCDVRYLENRGILPNYCLKNFIMAYVFRKSFLK